MSSVGIIYKNQFPDVFSESLVQIYSLFFWFDGGGGRGCQTTSAYHIGSSVCVVGRIRDTVRVGKHW